jgi:hypothetical protein
MARRHVPATGAARVNVYHAQKNGRLATGLPTRNGIFADRNAAKPLYDTGFVTLAGFPIDGQWPNF